MTAGRKKLPRQFHILNGTDKPCRRNDNEPQPEIEDEVPKPPKGLTGIAKRKWTEMAKKYHASGILSVLDYDALEIYCETWSVLQEAKTMMKKTIVSVNLADGRTIKTSLIMMTKNNNIVNSPFLGIANTARRDCHKFLSDFGGTPSSRTKLKVEGKIKQTNKFSINKKQDIISQ